MHVPRTATVTAMTPCVVASCDEATFDELVRPLFVDDGDDDPAAA
jgi:CRP-like cAMP-binding protein